MTRPGAASSLSAPCPFSLRRYQSDISSHSHDFAQLVIPLDDPQRHYLAFLHQMVRQGRHVAGMEQVWLGLLAQGQGMGPTLAPRMTRVQRHIETHLAEPLGNQRLAAVACLGQSQFKHAFRQQFGMSASHYIRGRRMALARTLLAHSALPIGEVASRCGYQDQGAFAERFLAETGLTPSRWRQQNGPQP
ncbi:helix-turn-helix domain-containing protein [Aeromonas media]|uniref:helix-turn-helix domain-containing protein n=1 Tax=Aeromonas media TaxID=651 RepID=UPI0022406628|nr:AraC family transcriptional regulator [Aeromonas media]